MHLRLVRLEYWRMCKISVDETCMRSWCGPPSYLRLSLDERNGISWTLLIHSTELNTYARTHTKVHGLIALCLYIWSMYQENEHATHPVWDGGFTHLIVHVYTAGHSIGLFVKKMPTYLSTVVWALIMCGESLYDQVNFTEMKEADCV